MATNSGNMNGANGNGGSYFQQHPHQHAHHLARPHYGPASGSSNSLPPASELLSPSPSLGNYAAGSKVQTVRHPLHHSSVASSPSMAPPSPFLVGAATPHYQPLTEPGTPATFLNPSSVDPAPSPSYESIHSPASNSNHVAAAQSANSTKPSTPLAECRASPIANGIYNASNTHFAPNSHYYAPPQSPYGGQRLPPVESLPQAASSGAYYNAPAGAYAYMRPSSTAPTAAVATSASYMLQPAPIDASQTPMYPISSPDYVNGLPPDYYTGDYNKQPIAYGAPPHGSYSQPTVVQQQSPSAVPMRSRNVVYNQPAPSQQQPLQPQQQPPPTGTTTTVKQHLQQQQQRLAAAYRQPSAPISTIGGREVTSAATGAPVHVYVQRAAPAVATYAQPQASDGSTIDAASVGYATQHPQSTHVVFSADGTPIRSQLMHIDNGVPPAANTPTPIASNAASSPASVASPVKKPPRKRNRKTAAQLRAEKAAAEAEAANQKAGEAPTTIVLPPTTTTSALMKAASINASPQDIIITRASMQLSTSLPMDVSAATGAQLTLMPPPRVAHAPSVVSAAKALPPSTPPGSAPITSTLPNGAITTVLPSSSHSQPMQSPRLPVNTPTTSAPNTPTAGMKRSRGVSAAGGGVRAQQARARALKEQEAARQKLIEERAFLAKYHHMRKAVRALVFKNGALADEVARVKMCIDVCKEETKLVAKRVQHYERNRIRRAQTKERKALARAAASEATTNYVANPGSRDVSPSTSAMPPYARKGCSSIATDDESTMDAADIVLPLNDINGGHLHVPHTSTHEPRGTTTMTSLSQPSLNHMLTPHAADATSAPFRARAASHSPRRGGNANNGATVAFGNVCATSPEPHAAAVSSVLESLQRSRDAAAMAGSSESRSLASSLSETAITRKRSRTTTSGPQSPQSKRRRSASGAATIVELPPSHIDVVTPASSQQMCAEVATTSEAPRFTMTRVLADSSDVEMAPSMPHPRQLVASTGQESSTALPTSDRSASPLVIAIESPTSTVPFGQAKTTPPARSNNRTPPAIVTSHAAVSGGSSGASSSGDGQSATRTRFSARLQQQMQQISPHPPVTTSVSDTMSPTISTTTATLAATTPARQDVSRLAPPAPTSSTLRLMTMIAVDGSIRSEDLLSSNFAHFPTDLLDDEVTTSSATTTRRSAEREDQHDRHAAPPQPSAPAISGNERIATTSRANAAVATTSIAAPTSIAIETTINITPPEMRRRTSSRTSTRRHAATREQQPRHSRTPSSIADSPTPSASPVPPLATGTPATAHEAATPASAASSVVTRRKAAEIAEAAGTPMRTRARSKAQGS